MCLEPEKNALESIIKVVKMSIRFDLISPRKQILKFSFEPKNEQKYFCISALGQIKKMIAHYDAN